MTMSPVPPRSACSSRKRMTDGCSVRSDVMRPTLAIPGVRVTERSARVDERPASLTLALRLLAALVLLGAVAVLLIAARQDDLIRSWAEGNPAVREVLHTRGLEA